MRYLSESELSVPFCPFGDGRDSRAACQESTPLDCIQELLSAAPFPAALAVSAHEAVSSHSDHDISGCIRDWKQFLRTRLAITGSVLNAVPESNTSRAREAACVFLLARSMLLLTRKGNCADVMDQAVNNDLWADPDEPLCSLVRALLPETLFSADGNRLYMNLFWECTARITTENGCAALRVHTDYPHTGNISIEIKQAFPGFSLSLRLPEWVKTYSLTVNGRPAHTIMDEGYLTVEDLCSGDRIEYRMSLRPALFFTNPNAAGPDKTAVLHVGPVIYCMDPRRETPCCTEAFPGCCMPPTVWDDYELYADRILSGADSIPEGFKPYRLCKDGVIRFPLS